ncbi:MAG: SMC family ATPase [Acidimicrobiia bacterium]|nr:SMC family ATPase [Acidimicrobiia bacterium]
MRPLELTLRGFQSYASEQTFDFRDRRLLGVVGPIGSGKSSLLDGIAFALYGKTPRAGRGTRDLINQRGASAHVELWFEVEGEIWRAVRALRRKGQSAHNLYRHAEADAESERLEEVTGERAMTARIDELLGLDFDAFNRSVFLAQNRFAEFLQATAAQRDAVLKGVFGFDRLDQMAVVAKARRDDVREQLADLERLRSEVEADRETLGKTTPALEAARVRSAELDASHARASELEAATEAGRRDVERAERRLGELEDVAAQLPARKQTAELLVRASAGSDQLEAAEATLASATDDLEAARRHHAATIEATGGQEVIAQAVGLIERAADLATRVAALAGHVEEAAARARRAAEQHEQAKTAAAALKDAEGEAQAAVADAGRAADDADSALHAARHESMAVTLRKELATGDTCPVCAQAVAEVPPVRKVAALERAEKASQTAHAALTEARGAHTAAAKAAAGAAAEIGALASALESSRKMESDAAAELAEAKSAEASLAGELAELVPGDDPAGEIEARRRALAEASALVEASTGRQSAARTALDEIRSGEGQVATELVQLATTVATLAGQLGGDLRPSAEPDELEAALGELRRLWESAKEETVGERDAAGARQAEAASELAEVVGELGLEGEETIGDARQRAASELGKLAERVEVLTARIAKFEDLEAGSAEAVARLDIYTTLADDLLPSRFLKFILDEERRALAALGSEHFERMTQGRYRFTSDGEFDVADLSAAEAERRAESLSGGETFLASLSLALALAEMVTRTGGRLDAFFLDEGFGSLDPEHLDLAMEGIEALVGGNRLVAVVSHVPQLRERVEDLIELDNDPVTGDTVVVRA